MSHQPIDSEPDGIEVHFDSCVKLTMICHKNVIQQIADGAKAPRNSPKGQDYMEFDLQIGDPNAYRINWGYTSDTPTDHGFLTVDVIPAPGEHNPLDVLRGQIASLKAQLK